MQGGESGYEGTHAMHVCDFLAEVTEQDFRIRHASVR